MVTQDRVETGNILGIVSNHDEYILNVFTDIMQVKNVSYELFQ